MGGGLGVDYDGSGTNFPSSMNYTLNEYANDVVYRVASVCNLRDIPHPMHQTVAQALSLVAELKPRRAWFTHIAHDLPHQETNERFVRDGFPQVQLAYDGLSFEVYV